MAFRFPKYLSAKVPPMMGVKYSKAKYVPYNASAFSRGQSQPPIPKALTKNKTNKARIP